MPFASRKYEVAVRRFLDMASQQCLHIFSRVFRHLLKLVNRDDTRLVSLFQLAKYFLQHEFRTLDIAKFNAECRQSCQCVETEFSAY